jgi:hypothetical protein
VRAQGGMVSFEAIGGWQRCKRARGRKRLGEDTEGHNREVEVPVVLNRNMVDGTHHIRQVHDGTGVAGIENRS